MLRNVLTLYILAFVIQALCALASHGAHVKFHAPRTITPAEIQDGWRSVFRRNLDEMLTPRQLEEQKNNLTVDLVEWDRETNQKCLEKLRDMKTATNPAGLAVCYNIPVFDKAKWLFVADMRLYKVSAPDAAWASVGDDIKVGLVYEAAAVNSTDLGGAAPESGVFPERIRTFHFIGRVQENFRNDAATDEDIKLMLTPKITLKGRTAEGTDIQTPIANNEASFINGVINGAPAPSNAQVEEAPFELPGKRIEIKPIGLILYGTWMTLGVSIVMFGTFERRKFRDAYRRRVAETAPRTARI